jgi:hypothetical protein
VRVKILRRCDRNLDHTLSVFGGKEPFAVKIECRIAHLRGKICIKTASNGRSQSRNDLRQFRFGQTNSQRLGDLLDQFYERVLFKGLPSALPRHILGDSD